MKGTVFFGDFYSKKGVKTAQASRICFFLTPLWTLFPGLKPSLEASPEAFWGLLRLRILQMSLRTSFGPSKPADNGIKPNSNAILAMKSIKSTDFKPNELFRRSIPLVSAEKTSFQSILSMKYANFDLKTFNSAEKTSF